MRKNSLARQARRAYDQGELARICTLREDRFGRAFGMQTITIPANRKSYLRSDRSEDYYHFRDNNSSVLAVAHLDTVVSQKGRVPHFRSTERGPLITSGALDDRLGAYVILSLLPKLGVTCDWLLTVGEESGASTAEHFDPGGKKYDWAIEFDRGGTDVVMYQYEDDASMRLVEAAGAEMGWGSFSDIAYLDQLGVKAFNWGVGYRGNYHSENGYAYLNDTFAMVAKYLRFHEQNTGTRLPHDPDAGRYGSRSYSLGGGYRSKYDYYYRCDSCGEKGVDSVTWYCTDCGICQDCGATDPDVAAEWNDPDVETCQCYAPEKLRAVSPDERQERDDWTGMTWNEYLAKRPGPDSPDDDAECPDCGKNLVDACTCALEAPDDDPEDQPADNADGYPDTHPRRSPSIAPPWSEHRPAVSHGLGVPASRKDLEKAAGLSGDLTAIVAEARKRTAVNPPAVFPDADLGWHAAALNGSFHVVAHEPGQKWAPVCLRCAARWPHPISGSRDLHPDSDCPGCHRCTDLYHADFIGGIHVIPAHLAGESDACELCQAEVHQAKATISRLDG